MRVDKVDQRKGIGVIKFNTDSELELIEESMNLLIDKQERTANENPRDRDEAKKLEKFKNTKQAAIEMPKMVMQQTKMMKQNLMAKHKNLIGPDKKIQDVEDTDEYKQIQRMRLEGEGAALTGDVEVTVKNMYAIAQALNEHIVKLEQEAIHTGKKDGKLRGRRKKKYEKLKHLLHETQVQKEQFRRLPPKPIGFGRLRK
jgi:hypothetical protein